jgi:hypothetical protein
MQLLRKAARENWGVPSKVQTEAMLAMYAVISDPASGRKAKLAAVRVLQQADRNDLLAERVKLMRLAQMGADTTVTLSVLVREMEADGNRHDHDRSAPDENPGGAGPVQK